MNMWNSHQHGYEEIREVVVDILLGRETVSSSPNQWLNLVNAVCEVLGRRNKLSAPLHPNDRELIRDVFWDLFRQGFITLGMNDSNPNWPFFRLSYFGQSTLSTQSPYRFHDTSSFIALIKREAPDISIETVAYLDEAAASFYAGCMLASCVMLGCAAETEFLRLIDAASSDPQHGNKFLPVKKEHLLRQKITKFHNILKPLISELPRTATEDIETNFTAIQSILRVARNEAGHPSAANPHREQVYVFLQLFAPFARQLKRLRDAFTNGG